MNLTEQQKEARCNAWMFILESEPVNLQVSEEFKEIANKEVNGEIEAHEMLDYVKNYIVKHRS